MYKFKVFLNNPWDAVKKAAKSKAMRRTLQKTLMVAIVVCFNVLGAWADSSAGVAGLGQATGEFRSYLGPIKTLLYVIAAIVSMVGAFSIYFKMQNGDQDVKKTIMMTVGGCVALIAMATALPAIFGETVAMVTDMATNTYFMAA